MKKLFVAIVRVTFIMCLLTNFSYADFREHFELGQTYLAQYRYTSAIIEFKSALKINYLDNSARIGLINSYLARGTEYANTDQNLLAASNDFRSALFYLKIYPKSVSQDPSSVIDKVEMNLEKCFGAMSFDNSFQNRFNTAKQLQAEGNLSAAAYEYTQALGDPNLQKECFIRVAKIMKILGNMPKAEEYYKKAVFVDPSNLNLRLEYAQILDSNDLSDEALKEYSYVLEKVGDDKEVLISLEKIFNKKLTNDTNNASLNANMGAILQKEGKFDDALTYYKQAEALDPSNINTRINTGTLYQQKGDYRTAIKAYDSVLILYPDNINANIYRAQCYEQLGDTKTAQEIYKKVMTLDPNNETIKFKMVDSAKKNMSPEQFVAYLKNNCIGLNQADIIYQYAIESHKNSKTQEAIYLYKEAIKLDSKNPEIFVNLSLAYAQENDYKNALNTLNAAQTKFPNDEAIQSTIKNINNMQTDSIMDKAAKAFNSQDYKEAIKEYSSIIPATADTQIGIANAYKELGDLDKAIEYYKNALKLKPVDSDIAYYIACLYGEKEDYPSARNYLEKAIVFDKNNTKATEYLQSIDEAIIGNTLNDAISLYDANKYDESLAKLNDIISKDNNNAYALYYRGMIYDAQEKRNEAIADLKKAYELDTSFTICNYLIAVDYDTQENYKDAKIYYSKFVSTYKDDDEYKKYAQSRLEQIEQNGKK